MDIIKSLMEAEERYRNGTLDFGELNIEAMAYDCRIEIENLRSENAMLSAELEALKTFKASFDRLYKIGFPMEDWHLNGSSVSFDEYYEHVLEAAGLG